MKNLVIDTGLVEYRLNDAVSIYINPTDSTFAQKLFDTFDEFDKKQEEYQHRITAETDNRLIWQLSRDLDKEMRDKINSLFGADIVTPLIGDMNIYALAEGMPIWANIIMAIVDEMSESVVEEKKKSSARVKAYTKKYHK